MATNYWTGAVSTAYNTAGNWSLGAAPIATNDVRLRAASTVAIASGLDQSAVAIADFIVEPGYSGAIGTTASGVPTYLQIDPDRFQFAGTGQSYIDIGAAAIDALIDNTTTPGTGLRGLYLLGSAIANLIVSGGSVGVAAVPGSTSTVATAQVLGGSLLLGSGTSLTTLRVNGGEALVECALTTVNQYGGIVTTSGIGAITTYNCFGGTAILNSSGTITTLNIYPGATVIFTGSNKARTVTTTVFNPGPAACTLIFDPAVITQTNKPTYAYPATLVVAGV